MNASMYAALMQDSAGADKHEDDDTIEDEAVELMNIADPEQFPKIQAAAQRTKKKVKFAPKKQCNAEDKEARCPCHPMPLLEDSDDEEIPTVADKVLDEQLEKEKNEFISLLLNDEIPEEELNTAEQDEFIVVDVAADSGAGDNVASKADAPGYEVRESAMSRRGGKFVGAGNHKFPNQGEMLLHMEAP